MEGKNMFINTNMASINAQQNLNKTNNAMQSSLEKLSSGYRINSAADDAAGLAISQKMQGQISGLNQASQNAQTAVSLIQTADGSLNETQSILQRMRELAVQSSSDSNTSDDRSKIQIEVDQLSKEITRISNTTQFNTQNLLAGGLNDTFQIGANQGQNISLSVGAMDAYSLGVTGNSSSVQNFSGAKVGIQGLTNLSRGFATATTSGYQIVVAKVAANASGAGKTSAVNVSKSAGTGTVTKAAVTVTNASGYTGTTNATYQVRVSAVSGSSATQIQYSTDNTNWTTASLNSKHAATIDGMTFTAASGTSTASFAVGDTFGFNTTAAKATFQLENASGSAIGGPVSVTNGSTSAVIGDAKGDQSVTVNYSFTGLSGGTAKFGVQVNNSSAATTVEGQVTSDAVAQNGIDVTTQESASKAITAIDNALSTVSAERAKLGAYQNRLTDSSDNLTTSANNLTAANSVITNVDMAAEMSKFTQSQVLSQAGVAMLAQANQAPQAILKLLG
jgi:flagellin